MARACSLLFKPYLLDMAVLDEDVSTENTVIGFHRADDVLCIIGGSSFMLDRKFAKGEFAQEILQDHFRLFAAVVICVFVDGDIDTFIKIFSDLFGIGGFQPGRHGISQLLGIGIYK